MTAMATRVAAWACLARLAAGAPTANFPVNAQVPPVARVGEAFSFVFAPNTFTSTSSNASMEYALDSAPGWLSLESGERWLHGTPTESDVADGDVVGIPFGLTATDETGSTTTNVTLVVSRHAAPTIEIPLSTQLAASGLAYSEPSSILSYPNTAFLFALSHATFSRPDLNYYAVSADNSPLPSWINFDAGALQFSGTTPPADALVEPPDTFGVQLIASDVTGFAAASLSFAIVVGSREITADQPAVVLNATAGERLVYTGLQTGIRVDGQVAGPDSVSTRLLSAPPSWLAFDSDTWALSGTPPASAQNAAFAVSFFDAIANTVNVTFQVDMDANGTVFSRTLPSMQARRGSAFALNLGAYLVSTDGVDVAVTSSPAQDWLAYNATTQTLAGMVPAAQDDASVSVSVRATRGGATESETFLLQVTGASAGAATASTVASATSTSTSTSTSSATASSTAPSTTPSKSLSKRDILMAVLIPTMFLVVALLILACCMCYRRQRKRQGATKDISDPLPFTFEYNGQDDMESSMRALDKNYHTSNLGSAQAQQKALSEKNATSSDDSDATDAADTADARPPQMPVGTALALPVPAGQAHTAEAMIDTGVAVDKSVIPNFPAPPSIHHSTRTGRSMSSASERSSTAQSHAQSVNSAAVIAGVAGAGTGQWPFEESTLKSESVHSSASRDDDFASVGSHERSDAHDALGIFGSANDSAQSGGNASVITRQTVRSATPRQMEAGTPGTDGRVSAGLRSEHLFESQEAIVHESTSAGSLGTVMRGHPLADNNTKNTNTSTMSLDYFHDAEAGIVQDGPPKRGLMGFASRLASRFKKGPAERSVAAGPTSAPTGPSGSPGSPGSPGPSTLGHHKAASSVTSARGWALSRRNPNHKRFSSAACSAFPSPDAPSIDTDVGSFTLGNITTAKPYKPKPVFIASSVNRITEESPQPNSPRWGQPMPGLSNLNSLRRPSAVPATLVSRFDARDSDASEDMDGETRIDDEALRLDPPRPAFLGMGTMERDASDLSADIASSLGNRRPSSTDSGASGLSEAMEEVRSLLLLTESGSGLSGLSRLTGGDAVTLNGDDDLERPASGAYGGYARSSNSWETLQSNSPNWTSMYDQSRMHDSPLASGARTNEPPTPATGVGLPFAGAPMLVAPGATGQSKSATSSPAMGSVRVAGSPALSVTYAQHQARSAAYAYAQVQQMQALAQKSQIRAVAASPAVPATHTLDRRDPAHPEHGLSFAETKFRHVSSFYDDDMAAHPALAEIKALPSPMPAAPRNEFEYPVPFVSSSASASPVEDSAPNEIGRAVSKYAHAPNRPTAAHKHSRSRSISMSPSRPQLHQTQASLVSTASSGIRAFI